MDGNHNEHSRHQTTINNDVQQCITTHYDLRPCVWLSVSWYVRSPGCPTVCLSGRPRMPPSVGLCVRPSVHASLEAARTPCCHVTYSNLCFIRWPRLHTTTTTMMTLPPQTSKPLELQYYLGKAVGSFNEALTTQTIVQNIVMPSLRLLLPTW